VLVRITTTFIRIKTGTGLMRSPTDVNETGACHDANWCERNMELMNHQTYGRGESVAWAAGRVKGREGRRQKAEGRRQKAEGRSFVVRQERTPQDDNPQRIVRG
jgi:hypothetical protein